jgi:c(7)-type cytochrome triheme protein
MLAMRKCQKLGAALIAVTWIATASSSSGPVEPDFSKFQHSNPNHSRLPCLLCHRRETNSAQPTLPGKDKHAPCTGCHAPQFASGAGPICTICHADPQSGTVKSFPPLRSFGSGFDHAKHVALGARCSSCHRPTNRRVAFTVPMGTSAHNACFGCHAPQAKANGRDISSCGVCHKPEPFVRNSQRAIAYRRGFSHANHDGSESLGCLDCHKVRAEAVTAPIALNHHAPARGLSCMTCHNGKRAFGGDDFSVCTRCHKGSMWRF